MRRKNKWWTVGLVYAVCCNTITWAATPTWEWSPFIKAIRQVETGGKPDEGRGSVGDDGDALGPYQIHEGCWKDAVEYDKSLADKTYADCLHDKEYSELVLKAYISRYLPKGGTPEQAARIWNGGPKGHTKKATLDYAKKFLKQYQKMGK